MKLRPPSEELKRFKPRQELDLPPRLFRQLLNPYKQAAQLNEFADEYASIHPKNCIGTFFDNDKKRVVKLNLGCVNVRFNFLYRAASSLAELPCQNSNEVSQVVSLSRVEGAAPCEILSTEHRPQAVAEDGAQDGKIVDSQMRIVLTEKSPGTSVIPGQTLTG